MDYYGTRRKRNLDLSGCKQMDNPKKVVWDDEFDLQEGEVLELEPADDDVELEEGEEEYEVEDYDVDGEVNIYVDTDENNQKKEHFVPPLYLNGQPFVPIKAGKKQTFADTHVRVTTYFEKNVHQIIRILQDQGQIESITKFVNDSIKAHLLNEYNDGNN